MEHKTHPKPKIVRTVLYECAYVTVMAVQIIFHLSLQTVINLKMLSVNCGICKIFEIKVIFVGLQI